MKTEDIQERLDEVKARHSEPMCITPPGEVDELVIIIESLIEELAEAERHLQSLTTVLSEQARMDAVNQAGEKMCASAVFLERYNPLNFTSGEGG